MGIIKTLNACLKNGKGYLNIQRLDAYFTV